MKVVGVESCKLVVVVNIPHKEVVEVVCMKMKVVVVVESEHRLEEVVVTAAVEVSKLVAEAVKKTVEVGKKLVVEVK